MDLQSQFSSFSSSSFTSKWKYDVFLSFRGQDTGHSFTRDLYRALCDKGILPFFDDDEFQRKEVKPIIEESRMAIVMLSPNYAASSSCLDELANIIDCIKRKNRLVLPIFYDVDPSDVRHQRNSIRIAMAEHEEMFKDNMGKVHKWKEALHQVANLSKGYQFKSGNGYEDMFIEDIVENISKKIRTGRLPIALYPVGLEFPVSEVISLLEMDSTDQVHMVGIHGIGGIGKTTLALAIYNLIADHFEDVCFLEHVRETSINHGLVHLQSILLNNILGDSNISIANVLQGISQIQDRFRKRKVLLILDDVDSREQLKSIAGDSDWFGPGSRVIITTRDKLLLKDHGVEKIYELKGLNMKESMDLLTWYAFKTDTVSPGYSDVLRRAATYAYGLPLALKVLGSTLYGRSVEECESMMDQLESPQKDILDMLKISFDALAKDEQDVFLDISCCFKGYKLKEIQDILLARYVGNMEHHIQLLADRSLISINQNYEVVVHDLLVEMGTRIVRQESPKMPGKQSRLWFYQDIVQVLEEDQGNSEIEVIHLKFPWPQIEEHEDSPRIQKNRYFEVIWDGKAFEKMENLKILIIKNGCFSTGPSYLPNSLRVLEWREYPSEYFPADFHPKELSILKLPKNILSLQLDSFSEKFVALRVLIFDYSKSLKELPDVSGIPNLQELSLRSCENLISVHPSVGLLNKLEVLNASSCYNLRSLPPINLPSLQILRLSGCSSLEKFPEVRGEMKNVKTLCLQGTRIRFAVFISKSFPTVAIMNHV